MFKKSLALAAILAIVSPLAAQVTEKKDPKEEAENVRREAVAFLRETMGDVANLRTLENRISFSAEMAGLMWYHDEREARVMFNSAIADFRELLSRLEHQMGEFSDGDTANRGGLLGDVSGWAKVETRYRTAMNVRQQIASSIAEHDPDVALSFFYDTASSIPRMQNAFIGRDSNFESSLIMQIAEKRPEKALQYGLRSLDKGFSYNHVDLLQKIYEKDPERGVEFAGRILDKIRTPEKSTAGDFAVRNLFGYGVNTLDQVKSRPGQPPVFTEAQLREIADNYSAFMLRPSEKFDPSTAVAFANTIERISPSRAMQLRARYGADKSNSNSAAAPPPPRPRSGTAANVYTVQGENPGGGVSENENSFSGPGTDQSAEAKLEKDIKGLGGGTLSKEERERVVGEARKILTQSRGRDAQIMGLSMLAGQVSKAGDRELAAEIMRDAERLVNPAPKNYQDFILTWMLASGYAEADPERAFPILEDAIGRANNIISAAVQVAEFVDVSEEIVSDGEVQVGAFGGQMIRSLSRELGVAEATINRLVHADFARTKALANRFDRPEVRVLAKMIVLRTVLGKSSLERAQERIVEQRKEMIDNVLNN